jgi:hypothetical protein
VVEISLKFNSYEEAVVALGKLIGGRAARAANKDSSGTVQMGAGTPAATTDTGKAADQAANPLSTTAGMPLEPTRTRKPRSDAGKARGSYKNSGAPASTDTTPPVASTAGPVAPAAPEPTAAPQVAISEPAFAGEATATRPTTEPVGAVAPAVAADPGPIPSEDEARAALEKVFNAPGKGLMAAQECLARVGAKRVGEVKPELRRQFIEVCADALK